MVATTRHIHVGDMDPNDRFYQNCVPAIHKNAANVAHWSQATDITCTATGFKKCTAGPNCHNGYEPVPITATLKAKPVTSLTTAWNEYAAAMASGAPGAATPYETGMMVLPGKKSGYYVVLFSGKGLGDHSIIKE